MTIYFQWSGLSDAGCGMCRSLVVSPAYIVFLFSCIIPANDASPVTSHNKQLTDIILPDLPLTREHMDSQRPQLFTIHADEANFDPCGFGQTRRLHPYDRRMEDCETVPTTAHSLTDSDSHAAKTRSDKLHQQVAVHSTDKGDDPCFVVATKTYMTDSFASYIYISARRPAEQGLHCIREQLAVILDNDISSFETNTCRFGTFYRAVFRLMMCCLHEVSDGTQLAPKLKVELPLVMCSCGAKINQHEGLVNTHATVSDSRSACRRAVFAEDVFLRLLSRELRTGQLGACLRIKRCQRQISFLLWFELKMMTRQELFHESVLSLCIPTCDIHYVGWLIKILRNRLHGLGERLYEKNLASLYSKGRLPGKDLYGSRPHASRRLNKIRSTVGEHRESTIIFASLFLKTMGMLQLVPVHGLFDMMTVDARCSIFCATHLHFHRKWIFTASLSNIIKCVESISLLSAPCRSSYAITEVAIFMIAVMISVYSISSVLHRCVAKLTSYCKCHAFACSAQETQKMEAKAETPFYVAKCQIENEFRIGATKGCLGLLSTNSTEHAEVERPSPPGDATPFLVNRSVKASCIKPRSTGSYLDVHENEAYPRNREEPSHPPSDGHKPFMRRIPPPRK